MKNKIYKTSILTLYLIALSFAAQAQFPNFTKVDTGAITQLWGGHVSSTCFDMDNDGDLDIFGGNSAVNTNRVFSFYKNEGNGLFIEMSAFITDLDFSQVSSFGDVDNDGDIDLFAGLPNTQLRCYENDSFGNYQLFTAFYSNNSYLYPSLIDFDNDGFLDVVSINRFGSVNYNNGNGTFYQHESLGLFHVEENVLLHSVSWGDADNDGDLDFYGGYSATNDTGIPINLCYLNNGNGAFVEFDPTSVIVEDTCNTLCVNWVDFDNDGDMDLYVHNPVCDNSLPALYENLGNMEFARHEIIDEIYRYSFASSGSWGDLDNDADLDLFITVENNVNPFTGDTSATPFNILYLNEGNGQFTDILEHPLTLEDSHTAMLFDHDNDGDLDVLMTRYSWTNTGYNKLFVNEGNDNSWIVLTCEGTTSNKTAIGARVQAKCFVTGNHITQTREITPINGHLSYANLRVHFGLGDADVIDTMLIRWPSGHIDTYLDVEANQFYRAIEDDNLEIEFKATNYIQNSPGIANISFEEIGETTTIDLKEHFHFIKGDTVPEIIGDTLTFSVYYIEDSAVVTTEVNGSLLTLEADNLGVTKIKILTSAGFTRRVDQFEVEVGVGLNEYKLFNPVLVHISPSPFIDEVTIAYEIPLKSYIRLEIYNYHGQLVSILVDEIRQQGKYEIKYDGKELPSGIYFCTLRTNEGMQTRKIIKL